MEETTIKWSSHGVSMRSLTLYCMVVLYCFHCSACGVTYEEVQKLGNVCPGLDSCAYLGLLSYGQQQSSIKDRGCNCDMACMEYGDCCIDARKEKGVRNNLNCHKVEQIGGVYMKDSCPSSYKGPEELRLRCEKTDVGSQADPLGSMPVTDPETGVTYKNYYCSICDIRLNDEVVMWTPKLECPLLSLMNASGSITKDYVLKNLVTDGYSWGLNLKDEEDGSPFFHECTVQPVPPRSLESKIRQCQPGLISDCPASWNRQEIRTLCKSYTGPRFDRAGRAYRNVHCAICNGVKASDLSCRSFDDIDIFREFGTHSFAVLLDISRAKGEQVGKISICKPGEVYDPFFEKCRGMVCMPGFVRRGRRCLMRNPMRSAMFFAGGKRRFFTPSSTTVKYRGNVGNATVLVPTQETLHNTTLLKA